MPYAVQVLRPAERAIANLPRIDRDRVLAAVLALADNPRPPGCKAMQGEARGTYRVRVGDYRVVYRVDDGRLVVLVIRVGNRREVYR